MSRRRSGLAYQRRAYCYQCLDNKYNNIPISTSLTPYVPPPTPPIPPSTSNSLFFDGSNNYLTMSPGITFGSQTTPFTIECWFYSTVPPASNQICIIGGAGGSSTNSITLYSNLNNSIFTLDSQGAANAPFTLPFTITQNVWYYIAVTRDTNSYIQLWIGTNTSGIATASTTTLAQYTTSGWNLNTASTYIGRWLNGVNPYNNGVYINNLRVTNTNLFTTSNPTIPVPTSNFTAITGTELLINTGSAIDQSNTQTITTIGSVPDSSLSPF